MSSTKSTKIENVQSWKSPVTVTQLSTAIFFSTYFLSIQLLELSLSTYVSREKNKVDVYRDYLLFKKQAPIWNWWQSFANIIVLLSLLTAIVSLIEIFTKKATIKRHVLDIIKAIQVFTSLYIAFTYIIPLENQIMQTLSKDSVYQLNLFQWIIFSLSLIGFFVPVFQYLDEKRVDKNSSNKKTQ